MQKIFLAVLMAVLKWMLSVASVKRWLIIVGVLLAAAIFLVPLLTLLTIAATGYAVYLLIQNRKKGKELRRAEQEKPVEGAD